ncbi:carbohydrate-binding module family 50 protein [Serendipita vermifera MAFF 305830]|uniref:Carbohydrate-binding module family 50 protein n=1 Tax=Serendipita vermifera MAFF 305830 TaxID=933852 RepID=A0A0C3B413_SERVB|nr:carbohydrate-binding module family 50 protein [Serendipita vermifera MAFF 305830]
MNDGHSSWDRSLLAEPPTPISANPWSDPKSSSNIISTSNNTLLLPSTRGRSTSIATSVGGSGGSSLAATESFTGNIEQPFKSNLRPRPKPRRLRSDLEDAVNEQNVEFSNIALETPRISSNQSDYINANGSTTSLGATRGKERQDGRPVNSRSVTPSTSAYKRRKSPTEPLPELHTSSAGDPDLDEDDKTREGKARKQGKSALRSALPSPFSFALGSGFGSKLWGDVETMWNEALSPTPRTATPRGGHAYLDVWGRPVSTPTFEEPERSRGRDRSVGDQGIAVGWTRGPLVERDDVSTSTTPSLSRKTTGTYTERSRTPNLISGEGITILDDSLGPKRATEVVEAEVFEHTVLPTDSLAGVALKYGVTVAQLRKANKMWASDTIHLRKVLYIPVGNASKKDRNGELVDLTSNMSQTNLGDEPSPARTTASGRPGSTFSSPSKASYIESSPSTHNDTLSESTSTSSLLPAKSISSTTSTKRIPISELSYFPPPSAPSTTIFTSNPHPSTISSGIARKWELQSGISSSLFPTTGTPGTSLTSDSRMSSRANSPSRNGLASSIFHAFPALNDITSRASFDTVRSAGSIPGSGNVSGEEDMELDEMQRRIEITGSSTMPSRGIKKRVKLRPRGVDDEGGIDSKDRGAKGKIITQQLAPRSMELPNLQASGNSASTRQGSYGEGWSEP